ncbi:MAG: SusD/RagB family nutrient-binding outer membrane lipoprotein, partial [Muribaculaceae bacterium]|nr:SusD/RagB family nutrient-binding outer membrane lipoprotein [Muribaculaceae bacterium]
IMAAIPLVGLTSCLDFDDPSDEFINTTVVVKPSNNSGNADKLDYLTPRTFDEAMAAVDKMGPEIQMIKSAQYYAKGSKEGRPTDTNAYQYFTAMTVDPYAGFWINAQSWTGRFVSTGSYYQEFLDGPYSHFTSAKNQVGSFLNSSYSDSVPELKAVALTVFNYSAAAALDLYGSIPYFDHKKNQTINPYKFDKGRAVYEAIVANLNSINACLKNFPNRPDDYRDLLEAVMMDCDGITKDKKFETWRRFANSLKLRLAMHMVKVDIDSAKKWAEEAVAEGVIESYDQEVGIMSATGSNTNPIFGVANQWGDSRCCAQFETLLASLNHPFKDMWFNENPAAIVSVWDSNDVMEPNTRVVGIRLGLAMPGGQGIANNKMFAYSTARADETLPNGEYYTSQINFSPLYFMKLSEVEFLRAEGALRGWNMGGDAQ